jgi:predicted PurR-regulated permease PerM
VRQVPEGPATERRGGGTEDRGDGLERFREGAERGDGTERAGPTGLREAAFGPPVETGLGRAAQLSLQLLVAAAIALVLFVIVQLRLVVLPVLAAVFLATILMPAADFLRRVGFPSVIYPVVVGRVIQLHPVAILLAVTAGAVAAGVVGALFAAPTVAILWTAVKYFRDEREQPGPREVAPGPAEG